MWPHLKFLRFYIVLIDYVQQITSKKLLKPCFCFVFLWYHTSLQCLYLLACSDSASQLCTKPRGTWSLFAAAAAKSLQSCPTLCDPTDGSPPGSPIPWNSPGKNTGVGCHLLLQYVKVKLLSRVRLIATPWTAAYQAPPSMGFSRQEHWSGLPLPSPGHYVYSYINDSTYFSWAIYFKWQFIGFPHKAQICICIKYMLSLIWTLILKCPQSKKKVHNLILMLLLISLIPEN